MEDSPNEKMRHALGVHQYVCRSGHRYKKPYRNYFVAGGSDVAIWNQLVELGHAKLVRTGSDLTGGDPVYSVTEAGKKVALEGIEFKTRWGYGTPSNP